MIKDREYILKEVCKRTGSKEEDVRIVLDVYYRLSLAIVDMGKVLHIGNVVKICYNRAIGLDLIRGNIPLDYMRGLVYRRSSQYYIDRTNRLLTYRNRGIPLKYPYKVAMPILEDAKKKDILEYKYIKKK